MEHDTLIPLPGFTVVAWPGNGVCIVDEDGHYWHVGGPYEGQAEDNELARAYQKATTDQAEGV